MQYHEIGKTGMKVSSLSFGASSLGGAFHDLKEKEGIQAVFTAVEAGMNFIDVSPYYGHSKSMAFKSSRILSAQSAADFPPKIFAMFPNFSSSPL